MYAKGQAMGMSDSKLRDQDSLTRYKQFIIKQGNFNCRTRCILVGSCERAAAAASAGMLLSQPLMTTA